jgi:Ala-tRNA(Pro) deacylase
MPPIGDLFGMEVLMEDTLAHRSHIAFNAGNHRQSIRLRTKDFMLIVHPRVAAFCNRGITEAPVRRLCKAEGCA